MKCSTARVVAVASWVVCAAFFIPGRGLGANTSDQGTFASTVQSVAYFYGANASDGSPPNWELAEAAHLGSGAEAQAVNPQKRAAAGITKGCAWSTAKDCSRSAQDIKDSLRDRRRGRSSGAPNPALMGPVVVDAQGSVSNRGTLIRAANLPAGSAGGKPALGVVSPSGSEAVPVVAMTASSRPSKADQHASVGADQVYGNAREDAAPSPYAMLLIGISLAIFMVIRRMGHV